MIKTLSNQLIYRLKYIKIKYRIGLPHARNVGIEFSAFEYLGFLDDDCLPLNDNFLMRAFRWLKLNKLKIIGVGGPIYFRSTNPPTINTKLSIKNIYNFKLIISKILEKFEFYYFKPVVLKISNILPGGNCFFIKKFVKKCGFFDPLFDGNFYREETDFCMRIKKYGILILDPKMAVNHLKIDYGGCFTNRERLYYYIFKNTIFLLLKHKRIIIEILMDTIKHLLGMFHALVKRKDFLDIRVNRLLLIKFGLTAIRDGITKYTNKFKYNRKAIVENVRLYPNSN